MILSLNLRPSRLFLTQSGICEAVCHHVGISSLSDRSNPVEKLIKHMGRHSHIRLDLKKKNYSKCIFKKKKNKEHRNTDMCKTDLLIRCKSKCASKLS